MISALTPMQKARVATWRARWETNAFLTVPMSATERSAVGVAMTNLYSRAGLSLPRTVIWVESPRALQLVAVAAASLIYARRHGVPVSDEHELIEAVGQYVGQNIANEVHQLIVQTPCPGPSTKVLKGRDAQAACAPDTMRAIHAGTDVYGEEVEESGLLALDVYDDHVGNLLADLGDIQADIDREAHLAICGEGSAWSKPGFIPACLGQVSLMQRPGNMGTTRAMYASFCREVLGIAPPWVQGGGDIEALAEACGPYVVHPDFAVVCDRPEILEVESFPSKDGSPPDMRLHAIGGPAVRYRDGFEIYAWRGRTVPTMSTWILSDPHEITPEAVLDETDERVRYLMRQVAASVGNEAAVYAGAVSA